MPAMAGSLRPEATALGTDRWAIRVCGEAGDAAARELGPMAADVGRGQRLPAIWRPSPTPLRRETIAPRHAKCSGQTCTAARSNAVADRSPSTPSIPAPPPYAHFRRTAPGWRECRRQYCGVQWGFRREHSAGAVYRPAAASHSELQLRSVRLEFTEHRLQATPSGGVAGFQPAAAIRRHQFCRRSVRGSSPGPDSTTLGPL